MSDSKVVLVTGASRGIGAAISDAFGAQGYIVAGTATSEAGAEKISADSVKRASVVKVTA